MQKNEALGFIMATLLGLVGCVLWGVLYYFEVIAGLAAYLIIFLAGVGYKKFGKIAFLEKKHYVIMVVISLVELALTFLICYGIMVQEVYASFGEAIGLIDAIKEALALVASNAEVKAAIISDAIFSLLFLLIGVVSYISIEKKQKQKLQVLQQVQGTQNIVPGATVTPYVDESSVQQHTDNNNQNNSF